MPDVGCPLQIQHHVHQVVKPVGDEDGQINTHTHVPKGEAATPWVQVQDNLSRHSQAAFVYYLCCMWTDHGLLCWLSQLKLSTELLAVKTCLGVKNQAAMHCLENTSIKQDDVR